ncbi:MAG TPA: formylglycine-generating enzyme family protein [Anaerolineales bacterium]|nr:formylglycine-generating enzyme family protein [Anaerolineales bacterium]
MKKVRNGIFALLVCLVFVLSSCGSPTPEVVTVVVTATDAPATAEPAPPPTQSFAPIALGGPQNGETMKWLDGSSLVYIPAGEFTMGYGGDAPVHIVMLDRYWIQQTKVTNRMYEQCVKAGACTSPAQELGGPVFTNPEFASHPVVGVNWDQAQAYCGWIQGSLPTEAQWEKSARGLNGNSYPWGNSEPACDLLNYANCYGRTTIVNANPEGASAFGLLDMAGNVFEWVFDWYDANYYAQSAAANPTGPQSGQYRGVRGSSFETAEEQVASAIRRFNEPTDSGRDIGFRCVVANPQPFAPYCQLTAQVPAQQAVANNSCALPEGVVTDQYCSNGDGYGVVQISFGATWEVLGTRMQCEEVIEAGIRKLVCRGPRGIESTNEVLLCNEACTNQPDVSGLNPVCDSGYALDPSTGSCAYSPILAQPGAGGCPAGYVTLDRGGQQVCAVSAGADGACPIGLYFDDLAGMCVPPNGETNAPFGIDNASLATQTYAGCAVGYNYNDTFQCCQPAAGATFPGCAPGYTFDVNALACVPVAEESLGGTGCVTVRVNTVKCVNEEDKVCAPIDTESRCVANLNCRWNEGEDKCELRP